MRTGRLPRDLVSNASRLPAPPLPLSRSLSRQISFLLQASALPFSRLFDFETWSQWPGRHQTRCRSLAPVDDGPPRPVRFAAGERCVSPALVARGGTCTDNARSNATAKSLYAPTAKHMPRTASTSPLARRPGKLAGAELLAARRNKISLQPLPLMYLPRHPEWRQTSEMCLNRQYLKTLLLRILVPMAACTPAMPLPNHPQVGSLASWCPPMACPATMGIQVPSSKRITKSGHQGLSVALACRMTGSNAALLRRRRNNVGTTPE
jgi:hypothetical protein